MNYLKDKVGDIRTIHWPTLTFGKAPKKGDTINNGHQNYIVLKRSRANYLTIQCMSEIISEVKENA